MGLDVFCWEQLQSVPKGKLLSLGYPDLLVPDALLPTPLSPIRPDSAKIAQWHGWQGHVRETGDALRASGFAPTFADIATIRGPEVIVDLNKHNPNLPTNGYDVVCDFGTTEHVFNIGNAFLEIWRVVKPGGYVIHSNPINRPNHGFWSISPTALADFWERNGGQIEKMVAYNAKGVADITPNRYDRFKVNEEFNVGCVVKIVGEEANSPWPTQYKYRT